MKQSQGKLNTLKEENSDIKEKLQKLESYLKDTQITLKDTQSTLEDTQSTLEEKAKESSTWQRELSRELSQEKQNNQSLNEELLSVKEKNSELSSKLREEEGEYKKSQADFQKSKKEAEAQAKEAEQELEQQRKSLEEALEQERRNKQMEFAERYKELRTDLKEKKTELKSQAGKRADLEMQINRFQKTIEKKGKDYQGEVARLLEELDISQKQRVKDKNEAQAREEKLKIEIREMIDLRQLEKESYKDIKSQQKEEISKQNKDIYELKESIKNKESLWNKEKEKCLGLGKEMLNLQESIKKGKQELEKQKEHFQEKMLIQKENLEGELQEMAEYKQKLNQAEEEKQFIEKEKNIFIERSEALLSQIEESEKEYNHKEQELDTYKNEILNLKESQANLKENIRRQSAELDASQKERTSLEKDIHSYRHRLAQLEKTLFSVTEEMRSKKLNIDQEKQKKQELRAALEKQEAHLKSLEKNLQAALSSKKKWESEHVQMLQNEKNRNAQFAPFVNILEQIAKYPGIKEKLAYLYTKTLKAKGVERIFIYSLGAGEELQLEGGYWQGNTVFSLKNASFSLQESIFGQSLASMKIQSFEKDPKLIDADLPANLKDLILKQIKVKIESEKKLSFISLVPLIAGGRALGILSLAADRSQALGSETIQLLSDLAPLLAIALQSQKSVDKQAEMKRHWQSLFQCNQYLQERYTHISEYVHQLTQKLQKQLPESIKANLMPSLKLPKGLLLPIKMGMGKNSQQQQEEATQHFIKWVDLLGDRVHKSIGLDFHQEINTGSLRKLNEHMGTSFSNVYWLTSEAVDNVVTHSHASSMRICLEGENGKFSLAIIDDGDGLARTAGNKGALQGRGLQAIQHLARASGAQEVEFISNEQGHGLSVVVSWDSKKLRSLSL